LYHLLHIQEVLASSPSLETNQTRAGHFNTLESCVNRRDSPKSALVYTYMENKDWCAVSCVKSVSYGF